MSAQEMASTLTGHHPEDARPRHPCASRPAQFRPHSLSSGAVRGRTRTTCLPRSGTLPAGGGWPGAVLESVSRGQPQSSPWAHFWAHSPPSMAVHRRPPGTRPRWPRTVADIGERRSAVLESVLGASPREFESRILRRADLQEYPSRPLAGWGLTHTWAHLVGSFPGRGGCRCRYQSLRLCLVTGIADVPRRRCARRQSVSGATPRALESRYPRLHSSESVRHVGTTELRFCQEESVPAESLWDSLAMRPCPGFRAPR